jgi:hypothetical protein
MSFGDIVAVKRWQHGNTPTDDTKCDLTRATDNLSVAIPPLVSVAERYL